MGAGKTLTAVILAQKFDKMYENQAVISNFHIDCSDRIVSNPIDLEEASLELEGLQVLDEVWAWADSRKTGENEVFNDMIINSRKRGWIIIYTAQDLHMVEKRLRDNTDYAVIPEHHSKPTEDVLKIHIFDLPSMEHVKTLTVNPEPVYESYDTTEEVGTDSKSQAYDDYINEGVSMIESGDVVHKTELKSYLTMEKDLSQNDAQDITNMAFMRADVPE